MKELLTAEHLLLFIISFLVTLLVSGILYALIISALILVVKYIYDRFLATKINPFLDKLLAWIKKKK